MATQVDPTYHPVPVNAISPSDLGQDLNACDREPIHMPGAIQPHGLLLVVEAASRRVVGGAGDIEGVLERGWPGASIDALIGEAASRIDDDAGSTVALGTVASGSLSAIARRSGAWWLIELEPAIPESGSDEPPLDVIDRANAEFGRSDDIVDLSDRAARLIAEITGFDRVMVYRFLDDDSGKVVAEHNAADMDGFLNHHFPASDIPKQARALYVRNRVRVIPDVDYVPAPIRSADPAIVDIDLSDVGMRAVSPIHIQYLHNMGVAASASVSIVKDGLLWGLIACHHREPRNLTYVQRKTCELVAAAFGQRVRAQEEASDYRERLRMRAAEDAIATRLIQEGDPDTIAAAIAPDLQRMMDADGFALIRGVSIHRSGHTPDGADIQEVANWTRRQGISPLHTATLPARFEPANAYRELASGVLAIVLPGDVPLVLMWFRAEELQTVQWAGNPHKAVTVAPGEKLTPRASFEAWSEDIRGRSRAWSAAEVEAAARLSRTLFEARQRRHINDLNRELTRAVADKDALLAQQDTLIKEVNHRVQNSLQLVVAFLAMQANAENDETLTAHLNEAQRRLSAVALVHRRLYADDNVTTVDLGRYVEDLLHEMQTSMGPEWNRGLTMNLASILISADAAVQVGLVLVELVINAQKYAYGGKAGPIAVSLERYRNRFRLTVADRGGGRTGGRKGFGTRMLNAMVQRLDGTIEEFDNQPGLRFVVSAPAQVPGAA